MNSRLSIRAASSTLSVDTSKAQRDEVSKIQQDVNILTTKIAELRGDAIPATDTTDSGSSPFVIGLRAMAETERKFKDMKELKLNTMEKLLEKVSEYDRILLKETTPVVDPNVPQQRRKSFGQDLYCLPTHLHLTARLMDLYAASKRVTVIKTTESGKSDGIAPPNPGDKKLVDSLKATLAKQTKQLEDSEAKRIKSDTEKQQLQRLNDELKLQVSKNTEERQHLQRLNDELKLQVSENTEEKQHLQRLNDELKFQVSQNTEEKQQLLQNFDEIKLQLTAVQSTPTQPPPATITIDDSPATVDNNAEIAALKAKIAELEQLVQVLQERLEVVIGTNQGMVAVALGRASRLNNHVQTDGSGDDCINLPADARNAFCLLEKAMAGRIEGLKAELSLIMSIKELLDGELSTSNLQRDILTRDLATVQEQHDALKAAYDALSYETARQQSQASSTDIETQAQLLRTANESNTQLLQELQEAQNNLKMLDKWPVMLAAMEEKLNLAVHEKAEAQSIATSAKDEVAHYKRLTETLKQKLRDLGNTGGDSKEFLDSFEEVMKEEMMTMKAAFESKLRLAREEADATSRRHQQEIVRMQASSPHIALNRAAALANATASPAGGGGLHSFKK